MDQALINRCRGCLAPDSDQETVMCMKPMPLAGMFCDTPEDAARAPVFPLTWVRCQRCGLVQVLEDIPDSVLFSRYNYASSSVPGLVRHFANYANLLGERYSSTTPLHFLEIGCNDGVLLKRLPAAWRRTGVDPSDVAARGVDGPPSYDLINAPFSPTLVREAGMEGAVDVISGSNCLAHISNLYEVFSGAALALKPGGHFWIEVHDLLALLRGCQWDTIYHEHRAEWSEGALRRCLGLHGFEPVETCRLPMHGGALRGLFRRTDQSYPLASKAPQPEQEMASLRKAYEMRSETPAAKQLQVLQAQGRRIAAYGAAGRANVYLNQLPELRFRYIVDESPLRMDKFIPCVGTPVVPPSQLQHQPADACLITAWNYRDDIIGKNPKHAGAWLTAFGD
jgi:SAM-dependent methyltransferase